MTPPPTRGWRIDLALWAPLLIFAAGLLCMKFAPLLTLPDSVLLPEGWETEPNRRYEISILEGCMSAQSWAVSANA